MSASRQPWLSTERPFIGLRPYGYSDHDFFFGREDQMFSLYRLLDRSRFIAVVGSSGSGKSSLVQAGLLPALDQETAGTGGRLWRWLEMRPGDAPLGNLANELAKLSFSAEPDSDTIAAVRHDRVGRALRQSSFGLTEALSEIEGLDGHKVLIVVDQFEELFRFARSAADHVDNARWRDEASHFVQLLLEAGRGRSDQIYILITMRSDFIGDCMQFHGLPEAVSATQFLVPSATREQREEIITGPLEKAGATIDPILTEQLLNDVSDEFDQLPVLQHCLMRLWENASARQGDAPHPHLTLEHYDAIGRMSGALAQHAEEVLAKLAGLELEVSQVFRALAEIDGEGRAVRRALPFAQLLAETGIPVDDLRKILDHFRADDCSFLEPTLAARPVLQADTRLDIGHESLLRRWGRIGAKPNENVAEAKEAGWLIEEERDGRKYQALLTLVDRGGARRVTLPVTEVEEWMAWWNARPRTTAWAARYGGNLQRVEGLLQDSMAALEHTRHVAQRQNRFARLMRLAAVVSVVVILGFALLAMRAQRQAVEASKMADAAAAEAQYERNLLLDQMTKMIYGTVEGFRLVPRSKEALTAIFTSAGQFASGFDAELGRRNIADRSAAEHLVGAIGLANASVLVTAGHIKEALKAYDGMLADLDAMGAAASDPIMAQFRAELLYFRGTAARSADAFAEADGNFTGAMAAAREAIDGTGKSSGDTQVVRATNEGAWQLLLTAARIRVDTAVQNRDIEDARRDLDEFRARQADYQRAQAKATTDGASRDTVIGKNPAEVISRQGLIELQAGRLAPAAEKAEHYAMAVDYYGQYDEAMRDMAKINPRIAIAYNNVLISYGEALWRSGRLEEGRAVLEQASRYFDDLSKDDKDNSYWHNIGAQSYYQLGSLKMVEADYAGAMAAFRAALPHPEALRMVDPENPRNYRDIAKLYSGMGRAAYARKDLTAAAEAYRTAQTNYLRAVKLGDTEDKVWAGCIEAGLAASQTGAASQADLAGHCDSESFP